MIPDVCDVIIDELKGCKSDSLKYKISLVCGFFYKMYKQVLETKQVPYDMLIYVKKFISEPLQPNGLKHLIYINVNINVMANYMYMYQSDFPEQVLINVCKYTVFILFCF